jgi:hypothetical protein
MRGEPITFEPTLRWWAERDLREMAEQTEMPAYAEAAKAELERRAEPRVLFPDLSRKEVE